MFRSVLELREHSVPDYWVVISELIWDSPTEHIVVPRGFLTDLASVPKTFRNILDINGVARSPAVLHDWLYTSHLFDRGRCDDLLYGALVSRGMSKLEADIYWQGVRVGGESHYADHTGPVITDFASPDYFNAWKTAA